MTNDYWFEAKNVSSFKNKYEVVKDLNLKLKYKENIIIIGPNGSGKSSLIELINRNIYPVIKKDTIFKIFNKEHIDIWELRKKISTVNYDVRTRINAKLKVMVDIDKFELKNISVTDTEIKAEFRINFINKPKVTISRVTGKMEYKAMASPKNFSGDCSVLDVSKKKF